MNVKPRLLFVLLTTALAACSSDTLLLQRKVDYRSGSDNLAKNSLEVPPDLTAPASSNTYVLPGKRAIDSSTQIKVEDAADATSARTARAQLVQAGGQRWLVVQGEPAKVWPEVREFWLDQGFLLQIDNPGIGIMETDWLENRANLPQDWVTKMLRKVADQFITTGLLDKFRTRIEQGAQPGTTEIYLSHRGMEEVFADGSTETKAGAKGAETKTVWIPRPTDPELEAEMLSLMLQRLGMSEAEANAVVKPAAAPQPRATLVQDNTALAIDDNFDRAWRRVGLALDRIGYVVYDRNRSNGVYFVRRAEADIGEEKKTGFWAKLGFGGKQENKSQELPEYEIRLASQVNGTLLTITGKDGAAVPAESRARLLSALQGQLR